VTIQGGTPASGDKHFLGGGGTCRRRPRYQRRNGHQKEDWRCKLSWQAGGLAPGSKWGAGQTWGKAARTQQPTGLARRILGRSSSGEGRGQLHPLRCHVHYLLLRRHRSWGGREGGTGWTPARAWRATPRDDHTLSWTRQFDGGAAARTEQRQTGIMGAPGNAVAHR
jgi:hypothetical protein